MPGVCPVLVPLVDLLLDCDAIMLTLVVYEELAIQLRLGRKPLIILVQI